MKVQVIIYLEFSISSALRKLQNLQTLLPIVIISKCIKKIFFSSSNNTAINKSLLVGCSNNQ